MSYIEGCDPNLLETSVESALGFYIPLIRVFVSIGKLLALPIDVSTIPAGNELSLLGKRPAYLSIEPPDQQ